MLTGYRYITPVPKRAATGRVGAVYAQSAAELGRLAEPYLIDEAETSLQAGRPAAPGNAIDQYIQMAQGFKARIDSQVKAYCK